MIVFTPFEKYFEVYNFKQNAWRELEVPPPEDLGEEGRLIQLEHSFLVIGGRVSCQCHNEKLNHIPFFCSLVIALHNYWTPSLHLTQKLLLGRS